MKYMLDTNIFNRILDEKLQIHELPNADGFVVTHVQFRELEATSNPVRREQLLQKFHVISPERVLAESFCLDVAGAGLDEAKLSGDDGKLLKSLEKSLDLLNKKNEKRILKMLSLLKPH